MPQKAQLIALETQRATDAVSDKNAESLNTLFSALAHPLRMQVLRVMRSDSFSVSELCAAFSVRQSALSHHLKILTDAGFLARRHEGTATFYRRQLPEGKHQVLRQKILDEIDEESMPADLVSGLEAVQRLREGHSAAFFRDRGKEIRKQQESIASWEDYSRATLHLLDRAGDFEQSAVIEVGPGDGALLGDLAKRSATVCALDNSEEMLHAAQHNTRDISNIEYHLGEPSNTDRAARDLRGCCGQHGAASCRGPRGAGARYGPAASTGRGAHHQRSLPPRSGLGARALWRSMARLLTREFACLGSHCWFRTLCRALLCTT